MSFWSRLFGRNKPPEAQELALQMQEINSALQDLQEIMQKQQKKERRQAQVLEYMHQELKNKLDIMHSQLKDRQPLETITTCAESFALYRLHQHQDAALEHTWNKFTAMLAEFDIQLILDHQQQFDDTRHEVCDTRWDPALPANAVLEVVRPGFIIQGEVDRPAMVVINSPETQQAEQAIASNL